MSENLTQEQIDLIPKYIDKWTRFGHSTDPVDWPKAEDAVRKTYECAGEKPPGNFIHLESPFAGIIATYCLSIEMEERSASLIKQHREKIQKYIPSDVISGALQATLEQIDAMDIDKKIKTIVKKNAAKVEKNPGVLLENNSNVNLLYGQHAYWLSFYDFFNEEVLNHDIEKNVRGLIDLAEFSGWCWSHDNCAIITNRPFSLHLDKSFRLHNEAAPATEYRDGFKVYAWGGIRLESWHVEEKERLTVAYIQKEKNTELRRALRNLYGTPRFLIDAKAKVLDINTEHGVRLLSMRLPGDPIDIRAAELTCPSTGEVYYERVPPEVNTALEALCWRWKVQEYAPRQQT